jgi:hypothetical protein
MTVITAAIQVEAIALKVMKQHSYFAILGRQTHIGQSVSQTARKPLKCRKMTTKDTLIPIITNGISQLFLSHLNNNECITLGLVTNQYCSGTGSMYCRTL